jgi:hypothetical protein
MRLDMCLGAKSRRLRCLADGYWVIRPCEIEFAGNGVVWLVCTRIWLGGVCHALGDAMLTCKATDTRIVNMYRVTHAKIGFEVMLTAWN